MHCVIGEGVNKILDYMLLFIFPYNVYLLNKSGIINRNKLAVMVFIFVFMIIPFNVEDLFYGYITACFYFFIGMNQWIVKINDKVGVIGENLCLYGVVLFMPFLCHLLVYFIIENNIDNEFPVFVFNNDMVSLVTESYFISYVIFCFLFFCYFFYQRVVGGRPIIKVVKNHEG